MFLIGLVKLLNGRLHSQPFNLQAVMCFKLLRASSKSPKPTTCDYLGCCQTSLALSATCNFLESLLFISTLGSSYSSEKCVKPFKIGITFCSCFKRRDDSIVLFLGMILLTNEPASLSVYIIRASLVSR